MNAFDRGMELLKTKGGDAPLMALRYARALCNQVGKCIEVMLTAFCWYAEKEEGLEPSPDDMYRFPEGDKYALMTMNSARETTWKPEWWDRVQAEKETSNADA